MTHDRKINLITTKTLLLFPKLLYKTCKGSTSNPKEKSIINFGRFCKILLLTLYTQQMQQKPAKLDQF